MREPGYSQSLGRGLAILGRFKSESPALGIANIADDLGMSRPTTHRYMITLVALGYLEQGKRRKYRLSRAALGPGAAVIGAIRRQVLARVVLEELRDEIGYTVSMGVLEGSRVVYVYRLFGHRRGQYVIDMDLGVGANVPAYCTALGKVMLASLSDPERRELVADFDLIPYGPRSIVVKSKLVEELDGISARKVVVSNEELVRGARSIAVLVPRPPSEHQLAIDVTVPSGAYTVNRLVTDIGPRVERTARLVSGR